MARKPKSKFDKLEDKLEKQPGVYSPGGLARKIGEDKYGVRKFNEKIRQGIKKAKKRKQKGKVTKKTK